MESYFVILRNYDTKQCSIIGALSENEEIQLTSKIVAMQNQNINCNRVSLNLNRSINEEIKNIEEDFTFVPVNNLFKDVNFIYIE